MNYLDAGDALDAVREKLRDRIRLKDSFRAVFRPDNPGAQDAANRVLRHLRQIGFAHKTTFVAGDSHQTARNEGARRILLEIQSLAFALEPNAAAILEHEYQEPHV